MIYLPGDCGHGFQTLVDDTEVFYMVSQPYAPASGRGVRWDDPAFGIVWPEAGERTVIARDREYPDFAP
jgi:dTDP-4-dehydrorhamnose 3,5-epimerase